MSGFEATRQVIATLPLLQIVMWTLHDDDIHRARAKAAPGVLVLGAVPQPTIKGLSYLY